MQIYNTLTKKKEEFVPVVPEKVKIYACGPTVYNYFHIGNARPFIVFDVLRRYLEYCGYEVKYVQNFTDIDDKMIQQANQHETTVAYIAQKYINAYYEDADALGIKRADFNPRATDHIDEIIELIQRLIDKGHAYVANNHDVYYSPESFEGYGKLSGQPLEDLIAGARVSSGEDKRSPADFALWKAKKTGEPYWDSPWGEGRPGWHIECSAMSMKYLGETFDIHAGGKDLIFPHHENEIAQAEGATGKLFAKYWMHNGYINVDNQKMSKSAGNFFMVRDIAKQYDLKAVRLFMLSAHYRSPINFSRALVEQAASALERLTNARERMIDVVRTGSEGAEDVNFAAEILKSKKEFLSAMDDDLNTADAMGALFGLVRTANTHFMEHNVAADATKALGVFDELTGILNIQCQTSIIPQEVLAIAEERQTARAQKDWKKSDELREKLVNMGYAVEDTKTGAKLRKISE